MADEENSLKRIQEEFNKAVAEATEQVKLTPGKPLSLNLDPIVDSHINELFVHTNIPILIYMVDFFNGQKAAIAGNEISIIISDKDGFVEATRLLPKGPLDIIIHSPGGSLEAAETIVDILRQKFNPIRFFVPGTAKSAATMLVLSGDEIFLASSAELGPIDPQMIIRKDGMITQSAAQAIIDQFETAQKDLSDHPNRLPAWIPILPVYGPSLYQDCKNAIKLSKDIVKSWLCKYMFQSVSKKADRTRKASRVVRYFANHQLLKSHARRIGLTEINANLNGLLKVKRLDDDPILYDKVMGVYYCFLEIFHRTPIFKIIQNSAGNKRVQMIQMPQMQNPFMMQMQHPSSSQPLI